MWSLTQDIPEIPPSQPVPDGLDMEYGNNTQASMCLMFGRGLGEAGPPCLLSCSGGPWLGVAPDSRKTLKHASQDSSTAQQLQLALKTIEVLTHRLEATATAPAAGDAKADEDGEEPKLGTDDTIVTPDGQPATRLE